MKKYILLTLLLLTSCATDVPQPEFHYKRALGEKTYQLDVSDIQYKFNLENMKFINTEFNHSGLLNNIEFWIKDTIKPRGAHNKLLVSVKNLEIKEDEEHRNNSLPNIFYVQDTKKINIKIDVMIELFKETDKIFPTSELELKLSYHRPVSELLSLTERQAVDQEIIKDIIYKLNKQLEQNFPKYFSHYINR